MQRPAVLNGGALIFSVFNYFTKPIAKELNMHYNSVGTFISIGNLFGVELT